MKAIKDYKWVVYFRLKIGGCYGWEAYTKNAYQPNISSQPFGTLAGCERNWKRFAKLNGIKKWKEVK